MGWKVKVILDATQIILAQCELWEPVLLARCVLFYKRNGRGPFLFWDRLCVRPPAMGPMGPGPDKGRWVASHVLLGVSGERGGEVPKQVAFVGV